VPVLSPGYGNATVAAPRHDVLAQLEGPSAPLVARRTGRRLRPAPRCHRLDHRRRVAQETANCRTRHPECAEPVHSGRRILCGHAAFAGRVAPRPSVAFHHDGEVPSDAETVERTFCFVDLAGFTALTEAHGDAEAVALLDEFLALTRAALGPEDELVKSIGDAVMLASPTADAAVRLIATLMASCQKASGFPLPRSGAHQGSAIARGSDYLGGAVNLAARVADHASGGQLLVTTKVAEAARTCGFDVLPLGPHRLRNVLDPVELFEVRVDTGDTHHTIDPVCRMHLAQEHATGLIRHEGTDYWFCSRSCLAAFLADPNRYVP
jgi:adenylate cyclase